MCGPDRPTRTIGDVRLPRISPTTYRRITLVALGTLVFIVVSGAAVRLTGSGLGCSDWPTCEQGQLVAPLELHPMIEFVNRTVTGLVSVPSFHVAGALVLTWVVRHRWWVLVPVGLLNLALCAATVLSGAHYAVDVLISLGLFGLSLLAWRLYRWVEV